MKFKLLIMLMTVIWITGCGSRYGFNFQSDWSWESLKESSDNDGTLNKINELQEKLSLKEARYLLNALSSLKEPADILTLSEIEEFQNQTGAGYYGYIPDLFGNPENIPVPEDFSTIIECAVYLTTIRERIDALNARSNFQYNRKFKKESIPEIPSGNLQQGINIKINIAALRTITHHYVNREMTKKEALNLANQPEFTQMLKNRKALGYIPEPLPDNEDLAEFIFRAGQSDPIANIWKWLNPWNYFGFADIFRRSEIYSGICTDINNNSAELAAWINSKVSKYLPSDFQYEDRLDFGVNWGVVSWGTDECVGLNLIHVKDDYTTINRLATAQIFRKIQAQILRDAKNIQTEDVQIKDIISTRYGDIYDRFFYEVLVQMMLEGITSYVAGKEQSWIIIDGVKQGKDLLNQIHFSLYENINMKTVQYCEKQGFGTNGPLVAIGHHITKELIQNYGTGIVYEILNDKYLDFYLKYIEIEKTYSGRKFRIFEPVLIDKINDLSSK